jgi:hypothetical protein
MGSQSGRPANQSVIFQQRALKANSLANPRAKHDPAPLANQRRIICQPGPKARRASNFPLQIDVISEDDATFLYEATTAPRS